MHNPLIFKALASVCASLILSSCLGAEGDSSAGPYAPIPDIEVLCNSLVPGCDPSQSGRNIFVGLLKGNDLLDCRDDLLHHSLFPPLARHFDASAETMATVSGRGPGLYGVFYSWEGSLQQSISSLERGVYQLCAFIDSNNNGLYDLGEPYAEGQIEIGRDLMPSITNWTHF